jgi:excisionase family DNA binding protein
MPPDAPLTVAQTAELLQVSEHTVLGLIAGEHLAAANIAPGKRRPHWRIERKDIESFLAARKCRPGTAPVTRRRGKPKRVHFFR